MKRHFFYKLYSLLVCGLGISQSLSSQSFCLECNSSGALNDGLEVCLPFNGNANDESGNGNNGTINGAKLTHDRNGREDSAYLFNGTSNYISINDMFDHSSRTYSVWFRVSNATTIQNVVVSDGPALNNGLTAISVINNNGLKVAYSVGSGANYQTDIPFNTWCHASLVVSNTDVSYYLNGKLVHAGTNNNFHSVNGVGKTIVGGSRDISAYWFNGSIDEVRIYSRALTAVQIDSLYLNSCYECDSIFVSNDSLEACFPFDANAIDETTHNSSEVKNALLATDRYGVAQNAYKFDGAGDYIKVTNLFDHKYRTYSVWFLAEISTSVQNIVVSDDPALDFGLTAISVTTTSNQKMVSFSCGNAANRSYPINNGVWYHAAVVVSDNKVWYYLNGNDMSGPLTNNYFSSVNGSGGTIIGGSRDTSTYWFKGIIDDLKIYARALDESEIMGLARDTSCLNAFSCVPDTGTGPNGFRRMDIGELTLYPNPGTGEVQIRLQANSEISRIRVFGVDGKEYPVTASSGTDLITLDLSTLGKGVYIIQVFDQQNRRLSAKYVLH